MPERHNNQEKRIRLTFEVEPDFFGRVEAAAMTHDKTIRAFCQEAISRSLEKPAIRFSMARASDTSSLQDFLSTSREVVMLGVTLAALHDEERRKFIARKISEGTRFTFLALDPDLPENNPIFQAVALTFDVSLPGELRHILTKTKESLLSLSDSGREARTPFRVRVTNRIPTQGLTMSDPFTPDWKIIVGSDLNVFSAPEPVFEIAATTSEGQDACIGFYRYYEHLLATSYPLAGLGR